MDPFQVIIWCTSLVFAVVMLRILLAIISPAIRGCIKSTRKTLRTLNN